mmetsp:Transcript_11165/g.28147  ORF Transcript_11165/g.28147 Transcript_11165/m.28147 type:complete len:413 (-) Transcript_11165:727-1965(-)
MSSLRAHRMLSLSAWRRCWTLLKLRSRTPLVMPCPPSSLERCCPPCRAPSVVLHPPQLLRPPSNFSNFHFFFVFSLCTVTAPFFFSSKLQAISRQSVAHVNTGLTYTASHNAFSSPQIGQSQMVVLVPGRCLCHCPEQWCLADWFGQRRPCRPDGIKVAKADICHVRKAVFPWAVPNGPSHMPTSARDPEHQVLVLLHTLHRRRVDVHDGVVGRLHNQVRHTDALQLPAAVEAHVLVVVHNVAVVVQAHHNVGVKLDDVHGAQCAVRIQALSIQKVQVGEDEVFLQLMHEEWLPQAPGADKVHVGARVRATTQTHSGIKAGVLAGLRDIVGQNDCTHGEAHRANKHVWTHHVTDGGNRAADIADARTVEERVAHRRSHQAPGDQDDRHTPRIVDGMDKVEDVYLRRAAVQAV